MPVVAVSSACDSPGPAAPVAATPLRAPASAAPGCQTVDEIVATRPEQDRAQAFPSEIHCAGGWASAAFNVDLGGRDEQGVTMYDTVADVFRFSEGAWRQADRDEACAELDAGSEVYHGSCEVS